MKFPYTQLENVSIRPSKPISVCPVGPCTRSSANKHNRMGGGTYSAEVGQNPLAECVPPDRIS